MKPLLLLTLALLLTACGEGEPLTPPDARLPDGARYRGELVDGLLQGAGRLDYNYLTSHGSSRHELALEQPGLRLKPLPATELGELLAPLKDRYKVVVISACYSGGFIPLLKDDKTLIMNAARADRVSFGCSEESDFTYFGRALFADAFNETDDLEHAFASAQQKVAEREQGDGFEASEPQLWAPKAVAARWRQAEQALGARSSNGVAPLTRSR